MKTKLKRLYINVMLKVAGVLGVLSGWLCKLSVKLATYAEDKNYKWFYVQAYVLGAESEISDAIRDGKELPVKPIAIVADGGAYYLAYDYELHKVREMKKTRVYKTKEEAYNAIKGFITTRNTCSITLDDTSETGTIAFTSEPVFKSTTITTVVTEPVKKGNGKRHIKHDKKQAKTLIKKGNGKYNKQPQPKKKVVKKVGK